MQDPISWNIDTAWALTSSIREFINFSPSTESQDIDNKLRDKYFLTNCYYPNYQKEFFNKLCKVLEENDWTISSKHEKLMRMKVQDRLLCARGEILIIKGYSERNISAIESERFSSYFLVAALSCNGSSLTYWKGGEWNRDLERNWNETNKPYYFYYCKMNPTRIHKYLRFEYYSTTYPNYYHVIKNILNYNSRCDNISDYQLCNNGLPNRDTLYEENKNAFANEINETVEKLKEENKINKSTITDLEAKIAELEGKLQIHESCQYQINELIESNQSLISNNELLKNEIQGLKSVQLQVNNRISMYEKEKIDWNQIHKNNVEAIEQLKRNLEDKEAQKSELEKKIRILNEALTKKNIELHEAKELNKSLQEKLIDLEEKNKANYSQILYDSGNEIIKLLQNRKHGLPSFGNTCYLNSLLQIFASTPLLARKIESINSPFCKSLSLLLDNMFIENSLKTISNLTQSFRQNLMATYSNIEAYNQQDAKEVFNMILSKIEEDRGNLDVFSIGFHQEFTCTSVYHHRSQYDDLQTFLIIPPQHKDSVATYLHRRDVIQEIKLFKGYLAN